MRIAQLSLVTSVLFSLVLGACAVGETDHAAYYEAAIKGGCHWDCPKCKPNDDYCMKMPCLLVCPPKTVSCGPTVCTGGQVCCNESCGICTQPGGFCIDLYCGFVEPGCTSDAQCRTFSNYCDGCSCQALSDGQPDPLCAGTPVECFADPCMGKTAVCDLALGACVLR